MAAEPWLWEKRGQNAAPFWRKLLHDNDIGAPENDETEL